MDSEFPHDAQSLFGNLLHPAKNPVVSWRRPKDFVKGKELALFKDGASAGDVMQGALGDCWFLGSLSCVGTREDLVSQLFVEANVEEGIYVVRFWKEGQWKLVTVDDYLPCRSDGLPAYAQSRDLSELWVMIAEKAFAKLHGSYAAIESGAVIDGFVDLTGGAPEIVDIETQEGKEKFWSKLQYFLNENWLMGCGISIEGGEDDKDIGNGLLQDHAYGVMTAVEIPELNIRLIQLRNPWGMKEWSGDWSDKSSLWTPELKKRLNVSDENDGIFWMNESDFLRNFNKFYCARLYEDKYGKQWQHISFYGEFNGKNAGGCTNHDTWIYNPQYCIKVTNPDTDLYVCMSQPDVRLCPGKYGERATYNHAIGFTVFNCTDGTVKKVSLAGEAIFMRSQFTNVRCITADLKLLPGKQYVLMPSTYLPGINLRYVLDIYADEDIHMNQIPEPEETSIEGSWVGPNAGGCMNHSNWKENPQYFFLVNENSKVTISLVQEADEKSTLTYIGLYMYKSDSSGPAPKRLLKHGNPVWKTEFINSREVGGTVELEKSDKPFILVPSTFEPNIERRFMLLIQSTNKSAISGLQSCISWKESKITGTWGGISAGGCRNHPTWRNNPMVMLTNSGASDVPVVLNLSIGREGKGKGVGIYVYPNSSKSRKLEGPPNEACFKAPFVANQTSVSLTCSPKNGAHLILPCTFDANVISTFTLTAYSDSPSISLSMLSDSENIIAKISGVWSGSSAGGGLSKTTWILNPKFRIESSFEDEKESSEMNVGILLVCPKQLTIGMAHAKPRDASSITVENIVSKSPLTSGTSNFFCIKASNRDLIIPFTSEAGIEGPFEIYAYASRKIKLSKLDT